MIQRVLLQVVQKYNFAKSQEKPHSFFKQMERETPNTFCTSKSLQIQLNIAKMHAVVPSLFRFFSSLFKMIFFWKIQRHSDSPERELISDITQGFSTICQTLVSERCKDLSQGTTMEKSWKTAVRSIHCKYQILPL